MSDSVIQKEYEDKEIFPDQICLPLGPGADRDERYLYQYPVMVKYLRNKIQGWDFTKFLEEYEGREFALYAISDFTDLVCDDIAGTETKISMRYICDRNAVRYKNGFKGYNVVTPDVLIRDYQEGKVGLIIICSLIYENSIFADLIKRGIREEDLISVASAIYSVI